MGLGHNARALATFLYSPVMNRFGSRKQEEDEPLTWTESKIISPAEIRETTDPALFYMESQLEDFL